MNTIPAALQSWFATDETPWTPLPDPGPRPQKAPDLLDPGSTVFVNGDFTIAANEDFYVVGSALWVLSAWNHENFSNFGVAWVENPFGYIGYQSTIVGEANWGLIQNYGKMVALAYDGAAAPIWSPAWGVFENYGEIYSISKNYDAYGVSLHATTLFSDWQPFNFEDPMPQRLHHLNAGIIDVWAGGLALGIRSEGAGFIQNDGMLHVAGRSGATGMTFSTVGWLSNTGEIQVEADAGNPTVGLELSSSRLYFNFHNSGILSANVAVLSAPDTWGNPFFGSKDIITNSGTITGDIILFGTYAEIINSGTIQGNVSLEDHEDFLDSSAGVINGSVSGGDANDTLIGGSQSDLFLGDAGDDTLLGGGGNDSLRGGADNDTLSGDTGDDTLRGNDGNDQLFAGLGDDRADGGLGDDFAQTSNGRDTALGGDGNDTLGAGSGNDLLNGNAGADLLLASNGADRLLGGDGDDTMLGGSGRDTLTSGAGNDRLVGGTENDGFNFNPGSGADWIVDFEEGAGGGDIIRLIGFGAAFDAFSDVLGASIQAGANVVIDLGGGDSITLQGVMLASLTASDFAFG